MQGKELEEILKGEGVIEPDEDNEEVPADEDNEDELQLDEGVGDDSQKESDEENAISTVAVRNN